MKIFHGGNSRWSDRINFVDDNNVLVGFDYSQCCCENFGYYLSHKMPSEVMCEGLDVETVGGDEWAGYNFDTTFNEGIPEDGDSGGATVFRLINGADELYLTLYNHHNGYYSHGFDMTDEGNNTIFSGSI